LSNNLAIISVARKFKAPVTSVRNIIDKIKNEEEILKKGGNLTGILT
jgi:hypothetical protein